MCRPSVSSRRSSASSALRAFPPFLYVSAVIGMSVMGILVRLQIQDNTLPSDLLIADSYDASDDERATFAPRIVRAVRRLRQHPEFDPSWDVFQRIEAEQTGRVTGPRTEPPLPEVNFIEPEQLSQDDLYSASWLQRKEDFLSMDIDGIDTVEDAAYVALKDDRLPNVRMSMDWLDFSAEHVSSWCDMMEVVKREIPFLKITQKLDNYLKGAKSYPVLENPALKNTLAVIAFTPYASNDNKHQILKAHNVTVRLLASTVESMRRAGFGRTVVVGMTDEDGKFAEEAFRLVQPNVFRTDGEESFNAEAATGVPAQLGHMEVAFVKGKSEHAKTTTQEENRPKAALQGLRNAFQGDDKDWLGERKGDAWSYVYLTESSNLLATKPASLGVLKQMADEGKVLVPHRLQPIPHQRDVSGTKHAEHLFLSAKDEDFHKVLELDSLKIIPHYCCDEHNGPDSKPGVKHHSSCGMPWFKCGFKEGLEGEAKEKAHKRLRKYKLIRLVHGSQLALLSAQPSGRKCLTHEKKLYNAKTCAVPLGQLKKKEQQ